MKYKLIDLLDFKTQGVNTTTDNISYVDKGYKIVQAKNIAPYNITFDDSNYIDEETFNRIKDNHKLHKGEVLFTNIGSQLGNSAIYESDEEAIITWNVMKFIPNKEIIDNYYLCNLLNSNKSYIKALNTSSTMPFVSGKELMNVEFDVPDLITQKKIVKILKDIEDKIKINNEINNNLQELAKSIYYERFKDKINNGKLKDILDLYRKSIKNKNESLKYFPVDVLPMNYMVTKGGKPNEEAQSSLVEFKKYDILVGAMRVYFHRVCLAAEDGITRTTTFVLRPKDANYLYYSLITLDKDDFIKYANDGSKGSTMPYAVWDNNCNEYDIYVPTISEAKEFNDIIKPLFEIQIVNEKNNRDLEQLRDTLLPRLMNGEIDLDEIGE